MGLPDIPLTMPPEIAISVGSSTFILKDFELLDVVSTSYISILYSSRLPFLSVESIVASPHFTSFLYATGRGVSSF